MNLWQTLTKLFTPAVRTKTAEQKLQDTGKANPAALQTQAGGSKSSGTGTFSEFLSEAQRYYEPKTVAFTPLSEEALRRLLEQKLRPVYDRAIADRRDRTGTINARLDADAYARGMGQSSYLSDVKSRSYRDEAGDVGALEAAYGAALSDALLEALTEQAKAALETERFNAEQENEAQQRAVALAQSLFTAARKGSGSGMHGTAKQAQGTKGVAGGLSSPQKTAKTEKLPDGQTIERVLSRLSGSEREKLYAGKTKTSAKQLSEIRAAAGRNGLKKLLQHYPG